MTLSTSHSPVHRLPLTVTFPITHSMLTPSPSLPLWNTFTSPLEYVHPASPSPTEYLHLSGEHFSHSLSPPNSLSLDSHSLTHILTPLPPLRTHPHLGASLQQHARLSYDTLPLTAPAALPCASSPTTSALTQRPHSLAAGPPGHTPPARPRPRAPELSGASPPPTPRIL